MIFDLEIEALKDAGFAVAVALTGSEAMEALGQGDADYRAMITDIDLGSGPSGWEVATQARELNPNMPIIYVSGASSNDWTSKGVPHSVMLVKPFAFSQLIVAVATARQRLHTQPAD